MNRTLTTTFITGLLMLPFAASALTPAELNAQINDLITKITLLQQQVGGSGSVQTPGIVPVIPSGVGSCPRIGRVLKMGSSGADVTRLQQFLAADPSVYPEANVSGYYGALTEAAVKRFQCKNRIVCDGDANSTGYGVTGPRTASILSLQCPDGGGGPSGGTASQVSGFIRVTPTVGVSPLNVSVEATVNTAHVCGSGIYSIDYGDGTVPASLNLPAGNCGELQQTFAHTYMNAGTYKISLRSGTHQVTASVTVSQGNSIPSASDSFSGSPTSGSSPLTVTFTGVVNAGSVCASGPYSISFGDGQSASISVTGCTVSNFSIPHTYANSGEYTARLHRGSPAVTIGSLVIRGGGSASTSGGSFSVSADSGGNALMQRAIFDIGSSCARYDVDWGDGTSHATQSEGSCSSGTISKNLSHTYSSSGTYTVTLKRGSSLNFVDTAGVTIVQ